MLEFVLMIIELFVWIIFDMNPSIVCVAIHMYFHVLKLCFANSVLDVLPS